MFRCFYRAVICISAVFAVTLCLSVTLVDCIQTAEDTVKLLVRPGSPIILVFLTHSAYTQLQEVPLQRGAKYTGVGKI